MLVHAARYALAIAAAGSGACSWASITPTGRWPPPPFRWPLPTLARSRAEDRSVHGVVHRGVQRVIGTLAGLAVTALLLLPHLGATLLAILAIALLFPTELFMTRHYGLALGFFTPLIMLMTELADPVEPWTILRDRAIDTLIGVAAGIAVALAIRGKSNPRQSFSQSKPRSTGVKR